MFGFINIYKPAGMTSFDVVAFLRRITKIKQIGHTGNLDTFEKGVLPVCIGKSTKLIEYLPDDKEYVATIKFGADTDTYDLEGQIVKIYNKIINEADLDFILKNFEGEIKQFPPKYSAIKVNGKKLYEYARKGEEINIAPRLVKIYKIKLLDFSYDNQTAKILVECSKGTYIRSIAYDIGQKLNCGGHLIALERTKAGMFCLENSVKLENINSIADIEENLINPLDVLPFTQYILSDSEMEKVAHGMPIGCCPEHLINLPLDLSNHVVFIVYSGKMVAVGIKEDNMIKVKKVFEVL